MFQAILYSILFEHIIEALITIVQLLIFQKRVVHGKTMSFVSRIMIFEFQVTFLLCVNIDFE